MRVWHSQRAAISSLSTPNSFRRRSPLELNHLLQICSNSKALDQGKQAHQQIILHGLHHDPFMATKVVQMYADCDDLTLAKKVFDKLSQPNVFAWTAILAFYSRNGLAHECLSTYGDMRLKGFVPDKYVFPKVLRACAQLLWLEVGVRVHKDVILAGSELNLQVCNSMIDMYSKCGNVRSARQVFDEMLERDLLSWNSMISGYVCNGFLTLAVELFNFMRLDKFEPDLVTWNTVMDAYCRMELCDEAMKIFEQIREPSIISWTTLISGYSRIGKHEEALRIFREMMTRGVKPDLDSLSCVLVSCRNLGVLINGREIHGYGIKIETVSAFYKSAGAALLTLYAKCKRVWDARNVFEMMDKVDVVTWNAMILGYIDLGLEQMALECFSEMQKTGLKNDQTTLATVLPVCDLKSGKQIHAYIRKNSFVFVVSVWNALIHMYSKCGCIGAAHTIFSSMASRDIVSWNTMVSGFGMHGLGKSAIQLLREMNNSGICPNSVSFISALSACSHSGLVDQGIQLFYSMTKDFGFNPGMEHYACVVDLLARAGRLEDAANFVNGMPLQPDKCIWGSLLAASRAHQNVSIGKLAAEHLFQLEPEHAGHYVTLSNIYTRAGKWEDAVEVRKLMESRGLVKPFGYSWIETGNLNR